MKGNQIVLWLLGGGGVFLLYCAVANYSPSTLIQSYFDKSVTPQPLTGKTTASTDKNGVTDPKTRGDAGPLLDPNNPNNLFPDGAGDPFGLKKNATYVTPTGQVQYYPAAYQSSPNTFIRA